MDQPSPPRLSGEQRAAADALAADLARIFHDRVRAVVAYGLHDQLGDSPTLHTLALLDRLTFEDLAACAPFADRWHRIGLTVPLLLTLDEFRRSLDVFPLEYGEIIARHVVISGTDPFVGAHVSEADVRRACEQQAKSHLIHLREGFLETGRDSRHVARLIASSAPAFRSLLAHIERLDGGDRGSDLTDARLADMAEARIGVPASLVRDVLGSGATASAIADPTALLSRYIAATERIWEYVDGWRLR